MGRTIGSVFLNQTGHEDTLYNTRPDTAWRGLRQREKFLEADIQRLLDYQATGLVSGTQTSNPILRGEIDGYSDAGSSTPTGTFYSTATSRSHMPRSLHLSSVSTHDDNVVPVRQPAKEKPLGLRSARNGLRTAIVKLVDLRLEENAHIDAAIGERMNALSQIERLNTKRLGIQSQLAAFNDDEEEPLGTQLREFQARHESVSENIDILEKKLMTLRNQRRFLWKSINDLKSKREADLSGYRGALKDVNSELHSLIRHPPILPLDLAVLSEDDGSLRRDVTSSGGAEFLRLIPERRTSAMAKSWWETELEVLEKRRMQVEKERQDLENGEVLWSHVLFLVTEFESKLRGTLQGETTSAVPLSAKGKGKETTMSEGELIDTQVKSMSQVLEELENAMGLAEDNGWNLLICAIGAELEAFREAYALLKNLRIHSSMLDLPNTEQNESYRKVAHTAKGQGSMHEESDTDAPPDLLISNTDTIDHQNIETGDDNEDMTTNKTPSDDRPHSQGSGNEVPLEFLTEHEH